MTVIENLLLFRMTQEQKNQFKRIKAKVKIHSTIIDADTGNVVIERDKASKIDSGYSVITTNGTAWEISEKIYQNYLCKMA